MTQPLFTSWLEADEPPSWRQRGLVIAAFAAGGVIAGALSPLVPAVDAHLSHLWYAGLSAALATLPLAGSLFGAGRRLDLLRVTLLSLGLALLGYVAFALELAALDAMAPSTFFWGDEGRPAWYDPGHLGISLFVAWGTLLLTWKIYVPCAVITGWAVSFLVHRRFRSPAVA